MCRSIKPLRLPDRPATEEEVYEAALQYVRKVSGYPLRGRCRKPSKVNQAAFDAAVNEVAAATRKMLENLLPAKVICPKGRRITGIITA